MAGTQGSSYSSPDKAAAANKTTTSNLNKGLNPSGSSKTSSGYGSKPASSSVNAAAANAARMAADRAVASQRTANSQSGSGYGRSNPASASVNAAAARASMMANQRLAGTTQTYGQGKGDMYGADQTVSKGTNLSAGDLLAGGYKDYGNPYAGIAMAARPNTTVYSKGTNLSSGDLLAGGYRDYQQPPSQQSTPMTAQGGWDALAGLQRAVSGAYPSLGGIVGSPMSSPFSGPRATPIGSAMVAGQNVGQTLVNGNYGPTASPIANFNYGNPLIAKDPSRVPSAPSIADVAKPENYNWGGPPNIAALNANAMNQAFNVNSMPKVAMEGGIPGGISPDSVPSLPNYASPVSIAAREPQGYSAPTQTFAQNLVSRGFTGGTAPQPTQTAMNSPMAGQGASFRSPASASQYNRAMGGLLGGGNQVASASPASSNDPLEHPLYSGGSTPQQKVGGYLEQKFEKIANPVQKAGDYVNGLLGGSGYNDLYGRPGMTDPNARDVMNNLPPKDQERIASEKLTKTEAQELRSLSDADKAKVKELVKSGKTLKEALKIIKEGTGSGSGSGGGTQTASQPLYYPQYYSTWAGLPSGQRYA